MTAFEEVESYTLRNLIRQGYFNSQSPSYIEGIPSDLVDNTESQSQGPLVYTSALAIELCRGSPPDVRDFLRIKFKNGTASGFQDVHVFGYHADIPLTESIYRAENAAVTSNRQ